jgi:adenosine kinase
MLPKLYRAAAGAAALCAYSNAMERCMTDSSPALKSPAVIVSASIAFDYIMSFPGSFRDHILPDKVHVLSVSFLYDSLRRLRGGVAGNIAYNLALLGDPPLLVGAGGSDFSEYRAAFEALGIDLTLVREVSDQLTGSSFMTTDHDGNQIAGFFPGASSVMGEISVEEAGRRAQLGLVGATTIDAMNRHAVELHAAGCPLIYDPSQQVASLTGNDIMMGVDLAWAVIGSDYELAIIQQKTGLSVDDLAKRVPLVAVTYGAEGSELRWNGDVTRIPPVVATPVADPTGGGDAYRAGLIKGILLGLDWSLAGRMGSLAATYAVERYGTQEHRYSAAEFAARFDVSFPEFASLVTASMIAERAPEAIPSSFLPVTPAEYARP